MPRGLIQTHHCCCCVGTDVDDGGLSPNGYDESLDECDEDGNGDVDLLDDQDETGGDSAEDQYEGEDPEKADESLPPSRPSLIRSTSASSEDIKMLHISLRRHSRPFISRLDTLLAVVLTFLIGNCVLLLLLQTRKAVLIARMRTTSRLFTGW